MLVACQVEFAIVEFVSVEFYQREDPFPDGYNLKNVALVMNIFLYLKN